MELLADRMHWRQRLLLPKSPVSHTRREWRMEVFVFACQQSCSWPTIVRAPLQFGLLSNQGHVQHFHYLIRTVYWFFSVKFLFAQSDITVLNIKTGNRGFLHWFRLWWVAPRIAKVLTPNRLQNPGRRSVHHLALFDWKYGSIGQFSPWIPSLYSNVPRQVHQWRLERFQMRHGFRHLESRPSPLLPKCSTNPRWRPRRLVRRHHGWRRIPCDSSGNVERKTVHRRQVYLGKTRNLSLFRNGRLRSATQVLQPFQGCGETHWNSGDCKEQNLLSHAGITNVTSYIKIYIT